MYYYIHNPSTVPRKLQASKKNWMMQSTTIQNSLECGMYLLYLPPHSFQKKKSTTSLCVICVIIYLYRGTITLYTWKEEVVGLNDFHYLCIKKKVKIITSSEIKNM